MRERGVLWAFLLGLPLVLSAVVIAKVPFSASMPGYWQDALQMAHTGRIDQQFTPSGYPGIIALGVFLGGSHPVLGMEVEQAVLQVGIVLLLWMLLRYLGAGMRLAVAGALLLGMDPELLLSVSKVWDVPYSTCLFLLIAFSVFWYRRHPSVARTVVLGLVWGLGCCDRPNFALLLPVLVWAGSGSQELRGPAESYRVGPFFRAGVLILAAFSFYAAWSFGVYRAFHLPGNGPYNLYAGNNSFTADALIHRLNAEPSIVPALTAAGIDGISPFSSRLSHYYTVSSLQFAIHHPVQEAELVAIKLFTLLRPDTKVHPLATSGGLVKGFLALEVPLWLAVMWWVRLRHREVWTRDDTLLVWLALIYVIPFLITNSDPRFRTPLDLLAMVEAIGLSARALSGMGQQTPIQLP